MLAHVHTPHHLDPEMLDDYLLKGWFRMGQNIFTTNFLNFKGHLYSAIWLRLELAAYKGDSTESKLRKLNNRFKIIIAESSITDEKEELFARYRKNVSFEASASLHQLMYGRASHNVYCTMEVAIYHEEKLVACGFFDMGRDSAAGIASFYDPEYKKYSLGKYLIYQKISHCKEKGLQYFYPGYFVPGYSFFDYKLSIGNNALEYLDLMTSKWFPIRNFNSLLTPVRIMHDKLNSLQILLAKNSIETVLFRYEFFEAALLPELKDVDLFDFPYFLTIGTAVPDAYFSLIVFDLVDDQYHLLKCRSLWSSNLPNENLIFSSELLQQEQVLFSSSDPLEIVSDLTGQNLN